ncbi:MAG: transcriptional repressor [Methanotrichaceae archaeon]|nr:transcriptional repressor [Methanotrichaceae archaeon]
MISNENLESSIIKTFRNSGYRTTPQRIAISRYILCNHEHPTARKAYFEVKKIYPTVSLATIYTTFKILKETGLIRELNLPQGQTRFDPNTEPHAHLLCLQCGSISDWMNPIIPKLIGKASDDANFAVIGSNVDLEGVCERCREAKNAVKALSLWVEPTQAE